MSNTPDSTWERFLSLGPGPVARDRFKDGYLSQNVKSQKRPAVAELRAASLHGKYAKRARVNEATMVNGSSLGRSMNLRQLRWPNHQLRHGSGRIPVDVNLPDHNPTSE